jgi:tRNA A-37 threonylcarbamoyl transferase component Bud32
LSAFTFVQVLHGDLAARNVLLADDGVAKVADFGMAKKMYYQGNYEKTGQVGVLITSNL